MTQVSITTTLDDDAARITAVLEALGYEVAREEGVPVTPGIRIARGVEIITRRHGLIGVESLIVGYVCQGTAPDQIAAWLEVSRATVKWHMHNIFTKTGAASREALILLTLTA